jgi:hypothetical protein
MSRNAADTAVGGINGRGGSHFARRAIGLLAAVFLASIPAATGAAPDRPPAISINIDVATKDCRAVTIDYQIDWQGLTAEMVSTTMIELHAEPGGYFLTNTPLDLGKKDGHWKGKIKGEFVRESGFFDARTYQNLSYQIVIYGSFGDQPVPARSNAVAIPDCVPMSPLTGPAAGGTLVTVRGGMAFADSLPLTMATVVFVGEGENAILVAPQEAAADGTWLTFLTPPGAPNTCVPVLVESLVFSLPSFCYGA